MSDRGTGTIGPRTNGAVAVGLGALAVVWLLSASSDGLQPAAIPQAALMWAWWLAAVLLFEVALLRAARRPPPSWPFVDRRLGGLEAGALVVLLGSVLLLREGVFGETAALELGWYRSEGEARVRGQLQQDRGPAGVPLPPTLGGAYLECDVACEPEGAVCDSFERWLRCDDDLGPKPAGAERAQVDIELAGMRTPGCWTPLVKQGRLEPSATVTIEESQGGQPRKHVLVLQAEVRERLTGLAPCRTLHERLGHRVANAVAENLQKVVER